MTASEQKERKHKTSSHRLTPRRVVMLVSILVIIVVGLWVQHLMHAPSEGSIGGGAPAAQSQVAGEQTSTTAYTGKYVSFAYPSGFSSPRPGSTSAVVPEALIFNVHDNQGSRQVALSVRLLQGGQGLQDDSGFHLRTNKPSEYSHYTATVDGEQATIFKRTDGTEITYYIGGSNKYATLSVTTTNPASDLLSSDLQVLINSFAWQR